MNSEKVEIGMVSSFHPHSMCYKVERVTAKTGCTLRTNKTISFEVTRFSDENSAVIKTFHFFNLILAPEFFCVQYEPFKATSLNFNPF